MKLAIILILALLAPASIPSFADAALVRSVRSKTVNTGGTSITPTVGAYLPAGSDSFDPALITGFKVGYEKIEKSIIDSIGLEGTFNYLLAGSKKADAGTVNGYLYRLDVTYPFVLPGKVLPSFVLGAGGIHTKNGGVSDNSPLINYGVSVKYLLEEWMGFRADFRHLLVYQNVNTRNNFEFSVGFTYYLDKERKKAAPPPPDADRDGVPDSNDKCPNSRFGEKVGKNGCPADTDLDGVPDKWDRCASTPVGVAVDKDGCAVESALPPAGAAPAEEPAAEAPLTEEPLTEEPAAPLPAVVPPAAAPPGSGLTLPSGAETAPAVPEEAEAEPPAAAAEEAPAEPGVPLPWRKKQTGTKKVVQVVTVEFPVDGTVIYAKYKSKIRNIAEIMRSNPGATALVEGHTDSSGNLVYNMDLSLRRAQSLKKEMVKYGVDPAAVAIKAYGPTVPVAGNNTREGKQRNRRASASVSIFIYE